MLVLARGDELLRDEVHAVVEAADVTKVGGAVEPEDRGRLVVRAKQDDRPVVSMAEPPVDPRRQLLHRVVELRVPFDLRPAGSGELDEAEPTPSSASGANFRSANTAARHSAADAVASAQGFGQSIEIGYARTSVLRLL